MTGLTCHLIGYILNRIFTEVPSQGARYFGVIWTQVFGTFSHPLNITWLSLACEDSEERALAMAMVITGANAAGIYGAQIFREDDEPRYRRAFSVACAILALGLLLAAGRFVDDVRRKVRQRTGGKPGSVGSEEETAATIPPSEDLPGPIVSDQGRRVSLSQGLKATT